MDGIKEMCQKRLLADNEKIIYIIIWGCGGVMFLKHFYSMLGKTDTRLIERLIDNGIIKVKQIGRKQLAIGEKGEELCQELMELKSVKVSMDNLTTYQIICVAEK